MTMLKDILRPQVAIPGSGNLTLVSSTLGASSGWYAHCLTHEILSDGGSVVLVSFTNEEPFHAEAIRKLGTDVSHHIASGRYNFIDGFSNLFLPPVGPPVPVSSTTILSAISGLGKLSSQLQSRLKTLPSSDKRQIILLHPEILIAGAGVLATSLLDEILDWHLLVTSTTICVSADSAQLMRGQTRMEKEHAAFVLSLAHEASYTVSLRMLDTGLAKDVSGVLRLTGKGIEDEEQLKDVKAGNMEMLYLVKETGVDVFGRGEMRG